MRQRIIIGTTILFFALVVFLMVRDMYRQKVIDSNPYEYSVENFKQIDSTQFCYEKVAQLNGNFFKVKAIAIDQNDQIIVGDSTTLKIFDKSFEPIADFMVDDEIRCIHAGDQNELFIGFTDHIEIWTPDGFRRAKWNRYDESSIITSIVSTEEWVCVADAGTKRLLLYDKKGNLIRSMGEKGGEERKLGFIIPSPYFDVDVSRDGHFWATNPGIHSLEAFDTTGRMISSWSKTSMHLDGFSGCCNPTHFAFLSDDSFVTCEKGLVRIKIHEPTGAFRCAVDGPLSFDEKESGMDMAINSEDDIFVLVPSEKTIYKYKSKRNEILADPK